MDPAKKVAIIEWIKAMVDGAEISEFKELKNHSTILLQLLLKVDPLIQYPISSNEKNISWVCTYLKDFFNSDAIDEDKVQLGNELELGKLLCLILELTLTSSENSNCISKIQCLPEGVQTNIMSMTKMVCDHSQKFNLGEIMEKKLRLSVNEESSILEPDTVAVMNTSVNVTPSQSSNPLFESPQCQRKCLDSSLTESTSPLAVFASSPQAMYRRVMVENKKLKQKVRHSELFLRRSEFEEQLTQDMEFEKIELVEKNKSLVKDQETLLQKVKDLEDVIYKLKEEIEFLQLEVQSKDKEINEQSTEMKKSNEIVAEVQTMLDKLGEAEEQLKQQKSLHSEEVKKNLTLQTKLTESEEKNTSMKDEILSTKQALENFTKEMEQRKKDHSDQLSHLQEELLKWERQSLTQAANSRETLSDALKRDEEISMLKEQVKRLQNTIKCQETTIVNMGYDTKSIQTKKEQLEVENEALRKEIEMLKKKSEESTENYKIQSTQYMDQISTLLKQVAEHSQRNEGLNAKMTSAEEKCKLLERQIEKCEQSENKINEQIQKQSSTIQDKDERILTLQKGLEERKAVIVANDVEKVKMEAKIQILTEDRSRLQGIEKEHQALVYENEKLKCVEKENLKLISRVEALSSVENLYKEAMLKQEELVSGIAGLKEENKQIILLKEQLNDMKEQISLNEKQKGKQEEALLQNKTELEQKNQQMQELQRENADLKVTEHNLIQLQTEYDSMKKTVEDFKKANTNSEISHQNLMKEISDLRLIEAKHNTLLDSEAALKETLVKLEATITENCAKLDNLKQIKQLAETESTKLKNSLGKIESEKNSLNNELESLNGELSSLREKYATSQKEIIEKEQHAQSLDALLRESSGKVKYLEDKKSELVASREKAREEIRLQQEKLNDLREVEINYKVILSENNALKTVSENLKNVSYAMEISEKNCQSLEARLKELNCFKDENTKLECCNKTLEGELKDNLSQREKLVNEIVELKGTVEKMQMDSEMSSNKKEKEYRKEKADLLDKISTTERNLEELVKKNEELQHSIVEITKAKEELNQINVDLEEECKTLKKEKNAIDTDVLTKASSEMGGDENSAELLMLEKDFEEKLKAQEEAFETNQEKSYETINDLALKIEELKEAYGRKEEEVQSYEALNREILDELKAKDRMIEKLEDKCVSGQVDQKRSAALARSLEMQLKSSSEVIVKLKKEVKELETSKEFGTSSLRRSKRQQAPENLDSSEEIASIITLSRSEHSDVDSGPLHESHLEPEQKYENKAEEIFQRSRSTRSKLRRSLIVMPTTREETETTDDDNANLTKTYSLRQRSDRRRSFQPRRYMGGNTPPSKRTLVGDPAQVQISAFNTETAEEPEIDYDWGRIASLSESVKIPTSEPSEEDRLRELQRRNTLCLPHLKSSYPMEVSVNKENNAPVPEAIVKDSRGKRTRNVEDEGPRGTYKKWKTENTLSISNDLSYLGRSSRSESSLRRETIAVASSAKKEPQPKPVKESCAFEITMEPPKKMRGKFPRSVASGNLKGTTQPGVLAEKPVTRNSRVVSGENAASKQSVSKEVSKGKGANVARFHRGEGVRSSFKIATQKVAASFRGKKMAK